MGELINVTSIAEPFREQIRTRIDQIKKEISGSEGPLLVGLLSGEDAGALRYAHWTRKACERDGIRYELRKVARTDLEDAIEAANEDSKVHGIMVYYPVFGNHPSFFGGTTDDYLRNSVAVRKDVEGLCHTYRFNLYHNIRFLQDHHKPEPVRSRRVKCIAPCTALSIVKILEGLGAYDKSKGDLNGLSGQVVTIVNRSEIVGRPLAAMLANDGADVYSVDIESIFLLRRGKLFETEKTLQEACKSSRIIILGVPSDKYKLDPSWVPEGCIVVNFSHFSNVDEESLLKIPNVKYVPQIGKVTVAMLERNTLRLYENFGL